MMERRDFLQACAVMLGSSVMIAGCGSGSDGASSGDGTTTTDGSTASSIDKQQWMELPSTQFSVAHDTFGAIDMELTNVEDEYLTRRTEQFSVTLTGPDNPLFEEGSYQVYNDSLGYLELYLQPGGSTVGQQNYRAIFNLLA